MVAASAAAPAATAYGVAVATVLVLLVDFNRLPKHSVRSH